MGHRKDNLSLIDFGYNVRPIAGKCRDDGDQLNEIDVESVPCYKNIRK